MLSKSKGWKTKINQNGLGTRKPMGLKLDSQNQLRSFVDLIMLIVLCFTTVSLTSIFITTYVKAALINKKELLIRNLSLHMLRFSQFSGC